ncbi:MAG: 1-hydroxy-2-methyl-2-butenyl 4-diphosphate reductase [Myxococcota bacterium]
MNYGEESLCVLAPLWIEARALRPALRGVEVAHFGMGARCARSAAEIITQRRPAPGAVAVAGVCGSLHARFAPGDVVVATELRGAGKPRPLESAKPLARALEARGIPVALGPIHSLDHLARRAERESLAAAGALAVDMESAWLGELADSLPFAVLRVVSDGPGHALFSPRIFANGIRALRALRAAAPALERWATTHSLEGHS